MQPFLPIGSLLFGLITIMNLGFGTRASYSAVALVATITESDNSAFTINIDL